LENLEMARHANRFLMSPVLGFSVFSRARRSRPGPPSPWGTKERAAQPGDRDRLVPWNTLGFGGAATRPTGLAYSTRCRALVESRREATVSQGFRSRIAHPGSIWTATHPVPS
jgi:hypothetical protein